MLPLKIIASRIVQVAIFSEAPRVRASALSRRLRMPEGRDDRAQGSLQGSSAADLAMDQRRSGDRGEHSNPDGNRRSVRI